MCCMVVCSMCQCQRSVAKKLAWLAAGSTIKFHGRGEDKGRVGRNLLDGFPDVGTRRLLVPVNTLEMWHFMGTHNIL